MPGEDGREQLPKETNTLGSCTIWLDEKRFIENEDTHLILKSPSFQRHITSWVLRRHARAESYIMLDEHTILLLMCAL